MAGGKRERWTVAEARGVLAQWRKSGQPLRAFTRDRGLGYERVRRWHMRLEAEPGRPFAPVEVARAAAASRPSAVIELRSGLRVTVEGAEDWSAVAQLVSLLERQSAC